MASTPKMHMKSLLTLLIVLFTLLSSIQVGAAVRPLHDEQWLKKLHIPNFPNMESLAKLVPPSGSNSCTYIPGGSGTCINSMNFAGRAPPPPKKNGAMEEVKFVESIKQNLSS